MMESFNKTVDKSGAVLDRSKSKFFKGGTYVFATIIALVAILCISFDGSAKGTFRPTEKSDWRLPVYICS